MKNINYPMTREYRKEWGIIEAVRELVQNCIDNKQHESFFEYDQLSEFMTITTHGYNLPMSTFALGESHGKSNETIGGFGEGYKLALLVLTREGCIPRVYTDNFVASTFFELDEKIGVETFNISILDEDYEIDQTTFKFHFPKSLFDELKHKVSVFSDKPLVLEDGYTTLIEDQPGDIYVDGLFICNEESFKYGYNFAPSSVTLGSDRAIANPMGLSWETSRYWSDRLDNDWDDTDSELSNSMLDMLMENQLDIQNLAYTASKETKQFIATLFKNRYGDVEIDTMRGKIRGFGVTSNLYNMLRDSGLVSFVKEYEKDGTPYNILSMYLKENKKHMRSKARKNLQRLLDQAKGWS